MNQNSIINGKLLHIRKFPEVNNNNKVTKSDINEKNVNQRNFDTILKNEINSKEHFKISNHARQRLNDRNISLSSIDMKNINDGINKAASKGAKDCLILYKDMALITSIKNRTIITALDKESSRENVFTNIDSVVLL